MGLLKATRNALFRYEMFVEKAMLLEEKLRGSSAIRYDSIKIQSSLNDAYGSMDTLIYYRDQAKTYGSTYDRLLGEAVPIVDKMEESMRLAVEMYYFAGETMQDCIRECSERFGAVSAIEMATILRSADEIVENVRKKGKS